MKHGCVFFGDCESSGTNSVPFKFAEPHLLVFLPLGLVYTNRLNQVYTERKLVILIQEKKIGCFASQKSILSSGKRGRLTSGTSNAICH